MINLVEIKATKRSYLDLESNLVIMGLFEEKNLDPNQKKLDDILNHQISHAMEMDQFNGKKDTSITLYGNDEIKRVHLVGLRKKTDFSTDVIRSIASEVMRFADKLNSK